MSVQRHLTGVTEPRATYIPDLTPSPDSVVGSDGRVKCIICGDRVAFRDAEVVGRGFRCASCARQAMLANDDGAAHLTDEERTHVPREPAPRAFLIAGLVFLVIAAIQWVTGWDLERGVHRHESLFVMMFMFGVGFTGVGWFRWRDRRNGRY